MGIIDHLYADFTSILDVCVSVLLYALVRRACDTPMLLSDFSLLCAASEPGNWLSGLNVVNEETFEMVCGSRPFAETSA